MLMQMYCLCKYMQIYCPDILVMILNWPGASDFNCLDHCYWYKTGGSTHWQWRIDWTNYFMAPGDSVIQAVEFHSYRVCQVMIVMNTCFYVTILKTIMKVTISLIGSYQKDLASWLVMENLIHWKGGAATYEMTCIKFVSEAAELFEVTSSSFA